ncbi:Ephrin [Necator americanus]|uniref:Ephrin n=1 Tax=Necator americanus TaxID=51031 RepID=W2T450_NECAM|nr:Ephrin [Necator americanus]ETN76021.1 Ephrin [Necator americanus]
MLNGVRGWLDRSGIPLRLPGRQFDTSQNRDEKDTLPLNHQRTVTQLRCDVSEEEYTHCFLQNPHLVGSCNNNTQEVTITVVFRQFTPTPGGMEFEPGRTYYFITTSDGTLSGIDRRKDGLCTERQMKVKFEVQLPKSEVQHHGNPKFAARTSQQVCIVHQN